MATWRERLANVNQFDTSFMQVLDPSDESHPKELGCMHSLVWVSKEQIQKLLEGQLLHFGDAEYGHFIVLASSEE